MFISEKKKDLKPKLARRQKVGIFYQLRKEFIEMLISMGRTY